jgi:hypothetical protein
MTPNNMGSEATIEDPYVFTKPWKLGYCVCPREAKDYRLFEHACHEGNKTIELMSGVFKR